MPVIVQMVIFAGILTTPRLREAGRKTNSASYPFSNLISQFKKSSSLQLFSFCSEILFLMNTTCSPTLLLKRSTLTSYTHENQGQGRTSS